jgi:hypothetical protein
MIYLLLGLIGIASVGLRALQPAAGFPAAGGDFGAHLLIAESLRQGHIWPLPYSGLVGVHSFAALGAMAGLSLSRIFLLLADVSLLGTGLLLMAGARVRYGNRGVLAAAVSYLLVGFPLGLDLLWRGALPQLVSWIFYAAVLLEVLRDSRGASRSRRLRVLALLALGSICYPDGLYFTLPVVVLNLWPAQKGPVLRWGFYFLPPLALVLFQARAVSWGGWVAFPGYKAFELVAVLLLLLALAHRIPRWKADPLRAGWLPYLAVLLGLMAASLLLTGELRYYSLKNLYMLGWLLPILVAALAVSSWPIRSLLFLGGVLFAVNAKAFLGMSLPASVSRWIEARSLVNPVEERCLRELVRENSLHRLCAEPVVALAGLPAGTGEASNPFAFAIVRSYAFNALWGHTDFDSFRLRSASWELGYWEFARLQEEVLKKGGRTAEDFLQAVDPQRRLACFSFGGRLYSRDGIELAACEAADGF